MSFTFAVQKTCFGFIANSQYRLIVNDSFTAQEIIEESALGFMAFMADVHALVLDIRF